MKFLEVKRREDNGPLKDRLSGGRPNEDRFDAKECEVKLEPERPAPKERPPKLLCPENPLWPPPEA